MMIKTLFAIQFLMKSKARKPIFKYKKIYFYFILEVPAVERDEERQVANEVMSIDTSVQGPIDDIMMVRQLSACIRSKMNFHFFFGKNTFNYFSVCIKKLNTTKHG